MAYRRRGRSRVRRRGRVRRSGARRLRIGNRMM